MNKNERMPPLDLRRYGSGWTGWKLNPYGRARDSRLVGPDGTSFTPGEILECCALPADVDFLRLRVRELEGNGLDHRQRVAVLAAVQALEQVLINRQLQTFELHRPDRSAGPRDQSICELPGKHSHNLNIQP